MGQEMSVTLIKLKEVGHIASLHVHMIQSKGVSKEEGAQDKGCKLKREKTVLQFQ